MRVVIATSVEFEAVWTSAVVDKVVAGVGVSLISEEMENKKKTLFEAYSGRTKPFSSNLCTNLSFT